MTAVQNKFGRRMFSALVAVSLALSGLHAQTKAAAGAEKGVVSISLSDAASKLQAQLFWDPLSGSATLSKNGHLVNFKNGEELVLFDYRELALLDAPQMKSRELFLTGAFVGRLESFFNTLPAPVSYRVGAILIDPGHGGKDPGAIGKMAVNGKTVDLAEKDIVLTVGKDVFNRLSRMYPDKKILLTRNSDTYPSLEDRVEMANSVKLSNHEAILYISIHANSAFNKTSSGFEVWYLSPDYRRNVLSKSDDDTSDILPILNSMMEEEFTTESILIAKSIMEGLDEQIGKQSQNRGIKEESWFVVRNARMPSILVELGFVSNKEEARLLGDKGYLQKCATGIYNGITDFITHFESSRGFISIQ
jgi:N-acetylmuramoyl-L-alanine amidase